MSVRIPRLHIWRPRRHAYCRIVRAVQPGEMGAVAKGLCEDRNPYKMNGTQRVNNVVLLQGEGDCVPCMEEGCERHHKPE